MRNGKGFLLPLLLLTVVTGALVGSGCRKENGIDNNNVVRTPYGVFFSDRLGALYNTTDGKSFKTVYIGDGYMPRTISTSGENILWIKKNLHISTNNGSNFNPAFYENTIPPLLVTPNPAANWTSMMLNVPSHGRIYVAASSSPGGIAKSDDNGITWGDDPNGPPAGTSIQSFAQLKNGDLYAIDNTGGNLFERKGGKLNQFAPVAQTTPLPGGSYQLTGFNNALVAADNTGANGILYSLNGGQDWSSYVGIPTNQEIYSVSAPFNQVLLAGTDSAGVYRLAGNTFQPSNNGLQPFTKVYAIAGKQDMYKNDYIIQYVYIATNKGIFRSEDLGQNWTLVRPGDFRSLY